MKMKWFAFPDEIKFEKMTLEDKKIISEKFVQISIFTNYERELTKGDILYKWKPDLHLYVCLILSVDEEMNNFIVQRRIYLETINIF